MEKETVESSENKVRAPAPQDVKRCLVIKHGALGDFVLATGPFAAIRRQHPDAHIVLLTSRMFKPLAELSPYFDEVWVDDRGRPIEIDKWWSVIKKLRGGKFDMVYDLQTSSRTNTYFRLMGRKKPLWSGTVDWCSHPHLHPMRKYMHTIDRQREQLEWAGIDNVPEPDISWLKQDISRFRIPEPFAVIVAGGSVHRPEKRWTEEGFIEVAKFLKEQGITPVFIGTVAEQEFIFNIAREVKDCVNLCGQTGIPDVAQLGREAALCLGNDTGPMHVLALGKRPSIVLFSSFSDPKLCAPRGKNVRILKQEFLENLKSKHVISLIREMLKLKHKETSGLDSE